MAAGGFGIDAPPAGDDLLVFVGGLLAGLGCGGFRYGLGIDGCNLRCSRGLFSRVLLTALFTARDAVDGSNGQTSLPRSANPHSSIRLC